MLQALKEKITTLRLYVRYMEWVDDMQLRMPEAEVKRAGVRMRCSGEILLLHKRQIRRCGALVWDMFRYDPPPTGWTRRS